ncbi:MAG: spermidine synthase [Panacagrimonas sp.]
MKISRPWRAGATLLLMMASGFAGLGYQVIWTQQCALWLGHESAAVLAVITAFFGGLAAGALLLGARIERSVHPERWYAACELLVALWAMLLLVAMAPLSDGILRLTGAEPSPQWQWWIAFGSTSLMLLPATAAMGATLPAMARATAQPGVSLPSIPALYAGNTFGAVLGVLGIAFWLAPAWGLTRTAALCIVLNLACAGAALTLLRADGSRSRTQGATPTASRTGVSARLLMTGLLGIGYEVLVVRVLSQVAENTVYTYAILLAIYLLGSSAGAAIYARLRARICDLALVTESLLAALSACCLIGAGSLWAAERLKQLVVMRAGGGVEIALAAEALLALTAFGLPTLVMGALFSHLSTIAMRADIGFSRALGINTLGAAAAPALFGVIAFPALGAKLSLMSVAFGYFALIGVRVWHRPTLWPAAGVTVAMAIWAPPLAFIEIPTGGRVLRYEEGAMAAVSVVEDAEGVARLRIDNRQQEGSSATRRVDARQALIPSLMHPAPRTALFLGLGTGVTAHAAAAERGLQVDAVELLPEVIRAAALFRQPGTASAPAPRLIAADARRYVRAASRTYDLIVSDNFHPARRGSGSLYTVEHFRAVRARLADGGVFCQWLPLHQLDLPSLRSIVQSFLLVYPGAGALLASNSLQTPVIGLVGRMDDARFDLPALRRRIRQGVGTLDLHGLGLEDEFAVLGGFIAGPAALRALAADAPANTDDHPVVAYLAPRATYAPESAPAERLFALIQVLDEHGVRPDELIVADAVDSQRIAAYWLARNRYIVAGRDVHPSRDAAVMLAQVREPLLASLTISPDFRPAYDPLIEMATALAGSNVSAARGLLEQLVRLQPARPEAAMALDAMKAHDN